MKRRARVLEVFVWASCWIGSACGDPGYQLDGGAEPFVNEDRATGTKQTPNKSADDKATAGKRAQTNAGSGGGASSEPGSTARAGRDASNGGQGASGKGGKAAGSGAAGHSNGSSGSAAGGGGGASGAPSNATKLGDPAACAVCEKTIPADNSCHGARDACLGATGTAARGTKAGASLGQLCSELVACVYNTGCFSGKQSSGDGQIWGNCLCGKGSECVANNEPPQGPCKDQFIAAAETAEIGQIGNRFYDPTLAIGLAVQVVECDAFACPFECGICIPENGPSATGDATCHPASNDADAGI